MKLPGTLRLFRITGWPIGQCISSVVILPVNGHDCGNMALNANSKHAKQQHHKEAE